MYTLTSIRRVRFLVMRSFVALMIALFPLLTSLLLPATVYAATSFTATPVVFDGKGKQREIIRYNVSVENTTKHVVSIYPWVTDIDTNKGEAGVSDLAGSHEKGLGESLARWIEVTRGAVDLLPGEKKDIGITVQINLNAKPGMYHATIHLSYGGDRASAEKNLAETSDIGMNIEVLDDINERLQLSTFMPDKNIFSSAQADFSYSIENIGNRGIVPHGKIRIYDRRGVEIATVDANKDGKRLEPSSRQLLSSVWSSGNEFGRYKAMLDLEYGGHGTLQDTVFFWVIPWQKLAGMFATLIMLCIIVAIVLHSYGQAQRGRRSLALQAAKKVANSKRYFGFLKQAQMGDDEEGEEKMQEEMYERRAYVKELREVELPKPIHTRLFSERGDDASPLRVASRESQVKTSHQVVLGNVPRPKPSPHHIINLKK